MVLQVNKAECGLACLAMVAGYYGLRVDVIQLQHKLQPTTRGVSLAQIIVAAEELTLKTRPLYVRTTELWRLSTPCILHWNLNHFVVLRRVTTGGSVVHDPMRGVVRVSASNMRAYFDGIALEFWPPKIDMNNVGAEC